MYGYEIFHPKLMNTLLRAARNGTASHAYIFEGEAGLGKSEAAMLFAKALLCSNREAAPCCSCKSCAMTAALTHPDIVRVAPEDRKKSIGVSEIEKMSAEAHIKPFYSGKKVFITNADLLTEAAQNKLLKLIEEPPEYAVFLFTATSLAGVLPTTQSRCVQIHFPPVTDDVTEDYIRKRHPEASPESLRFYVRYSAGIPKRADELISDEAFASLRADALARISMLFSKSIAHAYKIADFFDKNKDSAGTILDIWISFVRDMIAVQNDAESCIVNTDVSAAVSKAAHTVSSRMAVKALEEMIAAKRKLDRYVNLNAAVMTFVLNTKNVSFFH